MRANLLAVAADVVRDGVNPPKTRRSRQRNVAEPHALAHPVHASWLNQAPFYFSMVQRTVLHPNNFVDLDHLEHILSAFGRRYRQIVQPFHWRFIRHDLHRSLIASTSQRRLQLAA